MSMKYIIPSRFQVLGQCATLILVLASSLALAVPPRPPWMELEERAATEGVEAVRAEYANRLAEFESFFTERAAPATPDEFVQRVMAVSGIFEFGKSWASVEAREVLRKGRHGADTVKAGDALVRFTALVTAEFDKLVAQRPSMEAEVTPEHLAKYGPFIKNFGTQLGNKDELVSRAAILGGVMRDEGLVRRVFEAAGGKVRSIGREYYSPAEFMRSPPNFDSALRPTHAKPPRGNGQPIPQVQGAVQSDLDIGDDQKEKARALIRDLYTAMAKKDSARMITLFETPSVGAAYVENSKKVNILGVDFSQAEYEFISVGPSTADVLVSGMLIVFLKDNERIQTKGRKSFRVVFGADSPRIVGSGGN